jgi:hypothetical protein
LSLTPLPALVVLALRDPQATFAGIRDSELAKRLRRQGLLDDAEAWPWLERWRVLRERLGELSRQPVPGLEALLAAPAVVSLTPDGNWLYVARIDRPLALAFAAALNGVHPSGREVELERRHGIPLHLVRFGVGRIVYYVLADRLVFSNDLRLLQRSLDLFSDAKQRSALSEAHFAGLEARAERVGLALAVDPQIGPSLLGALGLQALAAGPDDFVADFDPLRWGPPDRDVPPSLVATQVGLQLDLSGLQLGPAWQALRSHVSSVPAPLLSVWEGVVARLGRGLWLRLVVEEDRRLAFTLWLDRGAPDSREPPPLAELVRLLLAGPVQSARVERGGTLWCAADGALCLAACSDLVAVTNRGGLLAVAGCPQASPAIANQPWLAVEVADGDVAGALLRAAGSPQGGRMRWAGP